VDAAAVRLLFWQTHYRQSLDFNDDALEGAKEGVRRFGEFHERLKGDGEGGKGEGSLPELAAKMEAEVTAALDDDLNAPRAVAALFEFVRAGNRELDRGPGGGGGGAAVARAVFERLMGVLDVLPTPKAADPGLAAWVAERLAARDRARKSKDFKAADAIRVELRARGVEIEDTQRGTTWRVV